MVEVKNLTKHFKIKKNNFFKSPEIVKALDGIDFSIPKGKTFGLVGESGSGKTTAARSLLRLIEPDKGEIKIDGQRVDLLIRKDLKRFRKKTQLVFQDPYSSLNPRMTVGNIIAEPIKIEGRTSQTERQKRLQELVSLVGLQTDHLERYPHEFSGGQRQRIGIARAIALNPKFIVLDEPVSALDVSIQAQILNLLADLQEKMDLTYLFVAHDLAVVKHMSDKIAVMYLGKIVEENTKEELYHKPLHPYTQNLLKSIPKIKIEKKILSFSGEIPSPENPPAGCHFHPRCPQAKPLCQQKYPEMKSVGKGRVACFLYS